MDTIVFSPSQMPGLLDYARKKQARIEELIRQDIVHPNYPNTEKGHLIGRMGESAVFEWLWLNGYSPVANFLDEDDRGCDIFLNYVRLRLEVKTWRSDTYKWGGRAISVLQMPKVKKKCDRIVWCSVDMWHDGARVQIKGWSKVSDFDNAPIIEKNNLKSYQLDQIRGMETF